MYSSLPWTKINGATVTARQSVPADFDRRREGIVSSLAGCGYVCRTMVQRHREAAVQISSFDLGSGAQSMKNLVMGMSVAVVCSDSDERKLRVGVFDQRYSAVAGAMVGKFE